MLRRRTKAEGVEHGINARSPRQLPACAMPDSLPLVGRPIQGIFCNWILSASNTSRGRALCHGGCSWLYLQDSTDTHGERQKPRSTTFLGAGTGPSRSPGDCTARGAVGPPGQLRVLKAAGWPRDSVNSLSKVWVQVFHSEGLLTSPGPQQEVRCPWEYDSLALFLPDWDDLVWFQFNPNALQ